MLNQKIAEEEYNLLITKAQSDPRILGVILSGGRGKGVATENSDYDVMLVTTDDDLEAVKQDYSKTENLDTLTHPLKTFRNYADTDTPTEYDKYNFTHNKAIIDKTGEIQKLIDEKGILEPNVAKEVAKNALDAYLNLTYRYFKNERDGNLTAAKLDACESIPYFLTFIFAIEERVKPYNKFLEWELENYPLSKFSANSKELLEKIDKILSANIDGIKKILELVLEVARENGCKETVSSWSGYYFG